MKRKIRNIISIVILAILSFPVGYVFSFVNDDKLVRSEYVLNFIIGGIAMIIVLGIISLLIYAILKSRKSADPMKAALIVYAVLLLLLFTFSAFGYRDAVKQKDREDFLWEQQHPKH